jgi:hypothetical protein
MNGVRPPFTISSESYQVPRTCQWSWLGWRKYSIDLKCNTSQIEFACRDSSSVKQTRREAREGLRRLKHPHSSPLRSFSDAISSAPASMDADFTRPFPDSSCCSMRFRGTFSLVIEIIPRNRRPFPMPTYMGIGSG